MPRQRRVEIVNPYISDRPIVDRLVAAARRGVAVRIVVPGKPTPPFPAAAFRHNYPRLLDAGVRILLHPDMAHAKVMVVDDRALIGGCNLDALSLYRNWELDLLFDDAAVAQAVSTRIVDRFADVATPVTVETEPKQKLWNAAMDSDLAAALSRARGCCSAVCHFATPSYWHCGAGAAMIAR